MGVSDLDRGQPALEPALADGDGALVLGSGEARLDVPGRPFWSRIGVGGSPERLADGS